MPRVVFFGSPDFAVPSLRALCASSYRPELVVTQPDRPAGRGRKQSPTAVRKAAGELGIPVMVMKSFRDEGAFERLAGLEPDLDQAPAALKLGAGRRGRHRLLPYLVPAQPARSQDARPRYGRNRPRHGAGDG